MASGARATLRRVFALSSWFCVPELGMTDYELLSRSSAFLVRNRAAKFPQQFHVLGSAHVTHPFHFPHYYQHDWLQHVKEANVRAKLECRDFESGLLTGEFVLSEKSFRHPSLDMVLLHLNDESSFLSYCESQDIAARAIEPIDRTVEAGETVSFVGNRLVFSEGAGEDEFGADDDVAPEALAQQIPTVVKGSIVAKAHLRDPSSGESRTQVFASTSTDDAVDPANTDNQVSMGMCGGPVVLGSVTGSEESCVGMLEGLAPNFGDDHRGDKFRKAVSGAAVFIESADIARFIRDVEGGQE